MKVLIALALMCSLSATVQAQDAAQGKAKYATCVACHGATTQMPLATYNQVKLSVQNNGLLDRISRAQGASGMMPYQGTRMPQTTIDLINDWNTDGLLE